jgi:hypothetical protein
MTVTELHQCCCCGFNGSKGVFWGEHLGGCLPRVVFTCEDCAMMDCLSFPWTRLDRWYGAKISVPEAPLEHYFGGGVGLIRKEAV